MKETKRQCRHKTILGRKSQLKRHKNKCFTNKPGLMARAEPLIEEVSPPHWKAPGGLSWRIRWSKYKKQKSPILICRKMTKISVKIKVR